MRVAWLGLLLAAGCEPTTSTGQLFEPVPAETATRPEAAPASAPASDDGGFDFDADARPDDESADSEASTEDLVAGLGLGAMPAPEPEAEPVAPAAAPTGSPTINLQVSAPPNQTLWPADALVEGTWGVRLLATVNHASPPRAILGLPDGSERVVRAGALLADAQVVVLAIGDDVVQIAEVTPQGDHARIQTQTVRALYPSVPRGE